MTERPGWRRAFDAVERNLSPRVGALVHSDEFTQMTAVIARGRRLFSSLGFTGEALLRDHIRDRNGELHDLVMLAHFVDGVWAGMGAIGLSDELGLPEA